MYVVWLAVNEKSRHVQVMLQHEASEFLLCTLGHGNLLQQSLDIVFTRGEVVTFFLNGGGTALEGWGLRLMELHCMVVLASPFKFQWSSSLSLSSGRLGFVFCEFHYFKGFLLEILASAFKF